MPQRVRALIPGGADAAADGALLQDQILPAVRDGGQITALRSWDGDPGRGIRICAVNVRAHATDHEAITQLQQKAEAGVLAMRVARTFPAADAAAAHRMFDVGGVRGRIVLEF